MDNNLKIVTDKMFEKVRPSNYAKGLKIKFLNNPSLWYYTKSNCEVCLLGIKGKLKPITNTISRCIISERREHSRKPDEVRERIVQLFGNLPRIELFARQKQEGWDCWGNDTNIIRG